MDVSPFEGLVRPSRYFFRDVVQHAIQLVFKMMIRPPEPTKPIEAPSLYFFPAVAQHVKSTTMSTLMSETEVSDMVRLVKEAFQCLGTFNLDLLAVYIKFFLSFLPSEEIFGSRECLGENAT